MRHINIAMEKMNSSTEEKSEERISLVERILQKTNNPKIAAVLALDLIMVGVDTVSNGLAPLYGNRFYKRLASCFLTDLRSSHIDHLPAEPKSRQTGDSVQRNQAQHADARYQVYHFHAGNDALSASLHQGNVTVSRA